MMRTKSLLMAIGLLFCCMSMTAQDTEKMKKQIASVKKSSQYIYAEAVAATTAEAHDMAQELLYTEINRWADSQKKMHGKTLVVSNRKEYQTELALPRGNMFRSFIYVKKSDIISTDNASILEGSSTTTSTPATVVSEPRSEVTPIYPATVMTIASITDYSQMAAKIKELKAAGKIGHYARYGNLERPEIYYLAVYNPQGQVVAVLTPGTERRNVKTGAADSTKNYSGCGAIGFTVTE